MHSIDDPVSIMCDPPFFIAVLSVAVPLAAVRPDGRVGATLGVSRNISANA